jgi:hypothetical protein
MSDSTDAQIISQTINNTAFQDRCRLRFINAAISASTEVLSVTTSALTAAASAVLHFTSTAGIVQGMGASDLFAPSVIPAGTIVESVVANTSVTLDNNVTGNGVASGDVINFAPVSHAQRLAFAGALFTGSVDLKMLAMVMLANATNRTNLLAAPATMGGNILDSDMDFQAASTFTGIALSRSW